MRIRDVFWGGMWLGLVIGLAGCIGPRPPFDASGEYEGTWSSAEPGLTCDFAMTLIQEPDLPYPVNLGVVGFVTFDYGCVLDQELLDQLTDLPELVVPLIGTMDDASGRIEIGVDSEVLDLPFDIALNYDGVGVDANDDGLMDTYAGDYTLAISFETTVAGYEVVDVDFEGTFTLSRTL